MPVKGKYISLGNWVIVAEERLIVWEVVVFNIATTRGFKEG